MRSSRLARAALALFRKRRVPEIGRDLPSKYTEGEKELDRRVKAAFPVGTSESEVVAALRGQGFAIDPVRDGVGSATFTRTEFVFRTIWSMRWRAQQGRVREIWGVYGVQAPCQGWLLPTAISNPSGGRRSQITGACPLSTHCRHSSTPGERL